MNEFRKKAEDLVSRMTIEEKIGQLCYDAPAIPRLGVPAYNWWNECLHGVARQGRATVFPQAIAMAATFDDELLHRTATAISDEARAKYNEYKKFGSTEIYQGLTFWSPNINIFRDPRWGRGHETYGEDPYLTGRMASAFIKGLQGEGKYRKTDATVKHFAVHSGPEKGRHGFNSVISRKDLFETYLEAFRYCFDNAKPAAVMGAYNRVNGEACCASKTLLGEILSDKFGFDGYVVSDCGAICDIWEGHHLTETETEAAALALNNGCHLNCGSAYRWLVDAYEEDMVTEETITNACVKLFESRFTLGMFSDDCEYDQIDFDIVESEEHRKLNRKMAQESIVLLKNNGILPLQNKKKIAVIGPNADSLTALLGNYNGTPSRYSTLLKGIQEAADGDVIHAKGCPLFREGDQGCDEHIVREAVISAQRSDVVILCMGIDSTIEGEEGDSYNSQLGGDRSDLSLPAVQRDLIRRIKETGTPIVFVNVSGSCMDLREEIESCEAVVQCFYPGAEGGRALADILFGKVSPSGRLPVTFYNSAEDLPEFTDYSMKDRTYRYCAKDVLFPFGYGLSYTSFAYSPIRMENGTLFVTVTNTGETEGDEVVQLYIDSAGLPDQPVLRLTDFKRISLKPGESAQISFTLKENAFRLFTEDGSAKEHSGTYTAYIGGGLPSKHTETAQITIEHK